MESGLETCISCKGKGIIKIIKDNNFKNYDNNNDCNDNNVTMTANTIHDILLTHIDLKSKYEYVHGRRDYTRTKMPVSSIQQTRDI